MLVAGFGGLALTLAWLSLPWPLFHDAPLMHYIAWRIGEGAVPYRDLFDMNAPGVYLLHLAVLRFLGPSDLAWRAFDLFALAMAVIVVALVARPWGRIAAVGSGLAFACYHLAGGAWQAGQRDFLLCPFLLVGALGVARWIERRRDGESAGRASLAWSGLGMGAAVAIKPHALAFAALLGAVVIATAWRAGDATALPALVYAAGVAAVPLALVLWLAAIGGLGPWWRIVTTYLVPLYSRLGRSLPWTVYRWQVWIPMGLAAALSVGSAAWHHRFGARHLIALLGVVYGVAHYVVQGKGWEYHLYPLATFVAVLMFAELEPLLARRVVLGAPLAASLLAALALLAAKGVEASSAQWAWDKERLARICAYDIAVRRRPGDTVQVLDTTEGGVHALFLAGARQPTRFLYDFHFFHDTDTPVVQALRAELIRDLDARPPRFIVLFERGWPAGGYERLDTFPELRERIATRYALVQRRLGYMLYAKRNDP